jgi:hypothetical protein
MTAALAKQNKKVEYSEAIDNKTTSFAPFGQAQGSRRGPAAMVRDNSSRPCSSR